MEAWKNIPGIFGSFIDRSHGEGRNCLVIWDECHHLAEIEKASRKTTEIFISRKVAHEIINRACDKNEAKCKCLEFKIFLGEREKPFFEYPIPATVLSKFPAPIVDLKTRKVLNREDLEPTVKMKVKEFSLVDQDEQNSTPAPVVDPRNKWRYLFGSSDKRAKQILAELLDECGQKDWAEKFGLNDPKTDRVDLPILPSVAMALRSKKSLRRQ